jgi:hypothetical protein
MKRLFYTLVLLAGFQFAQAQEVIAVTAYDVSTGSWMPLDSIVYDTFPNLPVTFPIMVYLANTGTENLLQEDTITLEFALNGFILETRNMIAPSSGFNVGDAIYTPNSLQIPISTAVPLNLGTNGNRFCAKVTSVTVNKIRKIVNTEHCETFTIRSVNIADIGNLKEVSIYPNPVRGSNLKIENLQEATELSLYNITGQLVKRESAVTGNTYMDVSHLSNGMYFLKLQSGKHVRTQKIQIVK